MNIPRAADAGINPKDMKAPMKCTLRNNAQGDCVKAEEKQANKGGSFTQYTLFLDDPEGNPRELRFLMNTHLNPLIDTWGENSENWAGNHVLITAVKRGKYDDVTITPLDATPKAEFVGDVHATTNTSQL